MSELREDDFLDNEPEQEVEIVEEAAEAEAEETPETETTEAGETEEVVADESKVEPTATEKEPWTLSAVLDEREKRQKAVAEAEELRRKLAKYEAPKADDDVSIFEDEKGFLEKQERRTAEALRNTALNMSEAFAESVFGEEKVAAAKQWMMTEGIKSPYALERFNAAKLPFHEVVKLFDDDQVRRDPESYKAKLRAEILAELKQKPSIPSFASKSSAGSKPKTAVGEDDFLKD